LFLLLSFLESIKNRALYLLENQSSAGRPQPLAAFLVQPVEFHPHFPQAALILDAWNSCSGKTDTTPDCENPRKALLMAAFIRAINLSHLNNGPSTLQNNRELSSGN